MSQIYKGKLYITLADVVAKISDNNEYPYKQQSINFLTNEIIIPKNTALLALSGAISTSWTPISSPFLHWKMLAGNKIVYITSHIDDVFKYIKEGKIFNEV